MEATLVQQNGYHGIGTVSVLCVHIAATVSALILQGPESL